MEAGSENSRQDSRADLSGPRHQPAARKARRWLRLLPWILSLFLLAFLIWHVSLTELLHAFRRLHWQLLLPWTAAFVLVIYCWDALCLRLLFAHKLRDLSYRTVLRARGLSYTLSILNYELGQGALAWMLSRAQGKPVSLGIARCTVLAYIDLGVLFLMGFLGALASPVPRAGTAALFCGAGMLVLAVPLLLVAFAPRAWLIGVQRRRWGRWLRKWDLGWRQMLSMYGVRGVYYGLAAGYAVVGIRLAEAQVSAMAVVSAIPIVALVNALPISVAGLGTREAALVAFLEPTQPANLLAFSLVWTICLVVGRATIGFVYLWSRPWSDTEFGGHASHPFSQQQ